jgi:hypothetical protein
MQQRNSLRFMDGGTAGADRPAGRGKLASITSGPLVGGAVTTTIEVENGGVGQCFAGTNVVCMSSATKDECLLRSLE